jgi:hypothetical protein
LEVKRPGRETDHSPPSSAEVKERVALYFHSPNTPSLRGVRLKKSTGTTLLLLYAMNFTSRVGMPVNLEFEHKNVFSPFSFEI